MSKIFRVGVVVAALATAGVGAQAAQAGGIKCLAEDKQAGYIVCFTDRGPGRLLKVRAGTGGARAELVTWDQYGEYDYTRTGYAVVADGSGLTITEDHYDSTYYDQEELTNTKHVGADGYHEHEEWTYYGPYGGYSLYTYDRSIDADGFDQRTTDPYGTVDRLYVDTNPAGGVGAGKTYYDDYGCLQEQSLTVDPASADPVALRLDCSYE